MKMYMVRRANYKLRPENMMGIMLRPIAGADNSYDIDHFKAWHRKRDAQAYIDSYPKDYKHIYSVITLESKP